eukprot:403350374
MLGKRKRGDLQDKQKQAELQKKKHQLQVADNDDDDSDLKNNQNLQKDNALGQIDEDELEFERKRLLEEQRQQKLLEQELQEELKLRQDQESKLNQRKNAQENKDYSDELSSLQIDNEKDRRTIFVSNINERATEDDLAIIFSDYGIIKNIDLLRADGSSYNKGRGFIEFETPEQAQIAVEQVNEKIELKGKILMALLGITGAQTAKLQVKLELYEEKERMLSEIEERKQQRKDQRKLEREEAKKRPKADEEEESEYEEVSYDEEDDEVNGNNNNQDNDSVQINTYL